MTIENMGGAIEHWLGFQDKIGRSFMMNEYALKYPLSDYLVNDGDIDIESIELEYPHPNFPNRLVDLAICDTTNNQLIYLFELKLAKSTTRQQLEKQRIFNDIVRLHLAKVVTSEKCYFIITGKSTNFQRDFRELKVNNSIFYSKWFSFTPQESITFSVSGEEINSSYGKIYKTFSDEYKMVQLPIKITTTCEFITAFKSQFVPYMTGIWSVA